MADRARDRRIDHSLVTVAHLDDAIELALLPLRRDMQGLAERVQAALDRLERRPIRSFARWLVEEAQSLHAAAAGAAVSAGATYLIFHFL